MLYCINEMQDGIKRTFITQKKAINASDTRVIDLTRELDAPNESTSHAVNSQSQTSSVS